MPEDLLLPTAVQEEKMKRGCMQRNSRKEGPDVWQFAGLRPDLTASVFTTRKLSAQSSNILMKMLRGHP